jgi:esterase/lipase superfamily enzyme
MPHSHGCVWFACFIAAATVYAQTPSGDGKTKVPRSPLSRHVANLYDQALANSPSMLQRDHSHAAWRVFYATNRVRLIDQKDQHFSYGGVPAPLPRLEYGECEVVIPTARTAPPDAEATKNRGVPRSDEDRPGVSCRKIQVASYNRFFEDLVRAVSQSPQRDVLVYVHGYNVKFEEAVGRTGQLALELPFNGVVVCYSWPSAIAGLAYGKEVEQAEGTVKHLWRFLSALQSHLGNGTRINLVAHGLGCRALMQGVAAIPKDERETRPFQHVVLAMPDIGVDKFPALAEKCVTAARHVTMYVSSRDTALLAAKNLVRQSPRAGDSAQLVIVPQVDTVDVTLIDANFLGQSYYETNRTALNELFQLIKLDNPPGQRPWLHSAKHDGKIYWQFAERPRDLLQAERTTNKK